MSGQWGEREGLVEKWVSETGIADEVKVVADLMTGYSIAHTAICW